MSSQPPRRRSARIQARAAPAPAPGILDALVRMVTEPAEVATSEPPTPAASDNQMALDESGLVFRRRPYDNEVLASGSQYQQIHLQAFGTSLQAGVPASSFQIQPGASVPTQLEVAEITESPSGMLRGFCVLAHDAPSTTSASASASTVYIWSLCKDKSTQKGIASFLFKSLAADPLVADATTLYLVVATTNTPFMTEFGRLVLYTRSGFRLVPQEVRLLTGERTSVTQHDDANKVTTSAGAVYVGAIRSLDSATQLRMAATKAQLLATPVQLAHQTAPQALSPIVNQFPAQFPSPSGAYYTMCHMELIRNPTTPTQLKSFQIPANVTLVTFTMPGSYAITLTPFYGKLIQDILPSSQHPTSYSTFVQKFPGYSRFPFQIVENQSIQAAGAQSYDVSLRITQAMQQFESRPIVTLCLPPGALSPESVQPIAITNPRWRPGMPESERQHVFQPTEADRQTGVGIRQVQMDAQAYAPGMTCLDYTMSVTDFTVPFANSSYRAARDERDGLGVYIAESGQSTWTKPTVLSKDVLGRGITLETFLSMLALTNPSRNIVVFVVGCAGVPGERYYSAFYEIAHRRSLNYFLNLPAAATALPPYYTRPDVLVPPGAMAECPRPAAAVEEPDVSFDEGPLVEPTRPAAAASSGALLLVGDMQYSLSESEWNQQLDGTYRIQSNRTSGMFREGQTATSSDPSNPVDATLILGDDTLVGRYFETTSGGRRRPPFGPTRRARRSSSSSAKRYTRRRRALRS